VLQPDLVRRFEDYSKMMNLQGSRRRPSEKEQGYTIPIQEFNAALQDLDFRSAEWYRANYGEFCRLCIESGASRQFLLTMLDYLMRLQRAGGDYSVPLVLLAATMLQTGYMIGRKRAETEILEGWMKL
jgi:hypothetical protein